MTAVEWLAKQYEKWSHEGHFIPKHLVEQALEMEKQQIIDAYIEGYSSNLNAGDSEKYYNETFGDVE